MSVSRISAAVAEAVIDLITETDTEWRVHSGDPGEGGTAFPIAGFDQVVTAAGTASWTDIAEDPATAEYGGMFRANRNQLVFGSAIAAGTATWLSGWQEDSAPYDTWVKNVRLINPVPFSENDLVVIDPEAMEIFASGAYPMGEDE